MNKIEVKINGVPYQTYLDDCGVQRFVGNHIIKRIFRMHDNKPITAIPKELSLNNIWIEQQHGTFTLDEVKEIYRLFEISVCGYEEVFNDDKIENPRWSK